MNITQPFNNGTTVFNASQATGSTIAACKAVAFDTSNTVKLADSGVTNDYPVIGFTMGSIPTGGAGTIQTDGVLAGFSSLTPGAIYFSDPATPGGITATIPVTTGQKIQVVGIAYSATMLLIDIEQAVKAAATSAPLTVASGSSFPGSPNLYDRFYRTDRGIDYYYNGTVWLSMPLLSIQMTSGSASTGLYPVDTGAFYIGYTYPKMDYDIYIETFDYIFKYTGTFNSSNYWNISSSYKDSASTVTNMATKSSWLGGRVTSTEYPDRLQVGVVIHSPVLSTTNPYYLGFVLGVGAGSPGSISISQSYIFYRLVG